MNPHLQHLWRCVTRAAHDTIVTHDGIEHAGYLAFLGLLSLFPFLVFVVAVLGMVSPGTGTAEFLSGLFQQLPPAAANALEPRIHEITSGPPQGLLTLAIVGAIWTASSAVEGLRTILNRAYRVHAPPRYLLRRSLSVVQMIIFAFILIVGMILLITLPALAEKIIELLPLPAFLSPEAQFWRWVIALASPTLLLGVIAWAYYSIPNIKQHAISVWPGAITVVALLLGTAKLFALYLSHFNQVTLIYGSLGGIIAALIFFYLCNLVLIFGAELNYHISQWAGMKVEEKESPLAENSDAG